MDSKEKILMDFKKMGFKQNEIREMDFKEKTMMDFI